MLSFRKGLAVVLAASVVGLVGCGSGSSTPGTGTTPSTDTKTAAASKPVNITFWHGMGDDSTHGKITKQLVDQFNSTHPDIHVDASYQGSYADLDKKITSGIAAGNPPTVIQLTDTMLTTYVKSKAVMPLDNMIPAASISDYDAALLTSLKIDGKLYAVPYNKSAILLFYNKKMVPTPPKTWDEFFAVAKQVSKKDTVWGFGYQPNVYTFGNFYGQTKGQWLDKDGKVAVNGAEGVDVLTRLVNATKDGSALATKPKEYTSDLFNQGRIAMFADTSASLAYVKPANGDPWGVAPLFKGPANDSVSIAGAELAIVASVKPEEAKAAATFIDWITNKDSTLTFATGKTGYGPVRKSAIADQKWKDFTAQNPEYGVLADSLAKGSFQPADATWGKVQNEITDAISKALLGQADPKAALDEAVQKGNADLGKK